MSDLEKPGLPRIDLGRDTDEDDDDQLIEAEKPASGVQKRAAAVADGNPHGYLEKVWIDGVPSSKLTPPKIDAVATASTATAATISSVTDAPADDDIRARVTRPDIEVPSNGAAKSAKADIVDEVTAPAVPSNGAAAVSASVSNPALSLTSSAPLSLERGRAVTDLLPKQVLPKYDPHFSPLSEEARRAELRGKRYYDLAAEGKIAAEALAAEKKMAAEALAAEEKMAAEAFAIPGATPAAPDIKSSPNPNVSLEGAPAEWETIRGELAELIGIIDHHEEERTKGPEHGNGIIAKQEKRTPQNIYLYLHKILIDGLDPIISPHEESPLIKRIRQFIFSGDEQTQAVRSKKLEKFIQVAMSFRIMSHPEAIPASTVKPIVGWVDKPAPYVYMGLLAATALTASTYDSLSTFVNNRDHKSPSVAAKTTSPYILELQREDDLLRATKDNIPRETDPLLSRTDLVNNSDWKSIHFGHITFTKGGDFWQQMSAFARENAPKENQHLIDAVLEDLHRGQYAAFMRAFGSKSPAELALIRNRPAVVETDGSGKTIIKTDPERALLEKVIDLIGEPEEWTRNINGVTYQKAYENALRKFDGLRLGLGYLGPEGPKGIGRVEGGRLKDLNLIIANIKPGTILATTGVHEYLDANGDPQQLVGFIEAINDLVHACDYTVEGVENVNGQDVKVTKTLNTLFTDQSNAVAGIESVRPDGNTNEVDDGSLKIKPEHGFLGPQINQGMEPLQYGFYNIPVNISPSNRQQTASVLYDNGNGQTIEVGTAEIDSNDLIEDSALASIADPSIEMGPTEYMDASELTENVVSQEASSLESRMAAISQNPSAALIEKGEVCVDPLSEEMNGSALVALRQGFIDLCPTPGQRTQVENYFRANVRLSTLAEYEALEDGRTLARLTEDQLIALRSIALLQPVQQVQTKDAVASSNEIDNAFDRAWFEEEPSVVTVPDVREKTRAAALRLAA